MYFDHENRISDDVFMFLAVLANICISDLENASAESGQSRLPAKRTLNF